MRNAIKTRFIVPVLSDLDFYTWFAEKVSTDKNKVKDILVIKYTMEFPKVARDINITNDNQHLLGQLLYELCLEVLDSYAQEFETARQAVS